MIDPAEHINGYTLMRRDNIRHVVDTQRGDYIVFEEARCRFVNNRTGIPITKVIHKTVIDKQGRHNLW